MNINTITPASCGIPNTPCIVTDDPSTEDFEGYTQFLQSHNIYFNNILNPNNTMNPDTKHNDITNNEAKEVQEDVMGSLTSK